MEASAPEVETVTERQRAFLEFIRKERQRLGVAPSYDELAEHMGTCLTVAAKAIRTLTRKGLLARTVGVHRSLRLTDAGTAILTTGNRE